MTEDKNLNTLLAKLFPQGFTVTHDGLFFSGTGVCAASEVALIGSTQNAAIGIELAFQMASCVLDVIEHHPKRPILLLVDTQGQRLTHRDELLGINGYMAHLAKCLDVARAQGHRILGLVYAHAVSGGFLASSLLADKCYALPQAEVRVMNLPAMARITKIAQSRLEALSQTSPVFAPGVENYYQMGAIEEIWQDDDQSNKTLACCLIEAIKKSHSGDERSALGQARKGRLMARQVKDMVVADVGHHG